MVKVTKEAVLIKPRDLKPSSSKFEILGVLNPGVQRLNNGDIIMYVRVLERLIIRQDKKYFYAPRFAGKEKFKIKIDKFKKEDIEHFSDFDFSFKDGTKRLTFISYLKRIILDSTGFNIKSIDRNPSFFGLSWDGELGIEDPRITKIKDLYVMTYVSLSRFGNISTSYAISNDCLKWYRRGLIFKEQNKDVVLFPELINGKYIAFDRPEGGFQFTPPHIWISYSKDLEFWGESESMTLAQKSDWDYGKVGAGPPPIKTNKGWLLIYHGVISSKKKGIRQYIMRRMEMPEIFEDTEEIYCVGVALLDLKDPKRVIARSKVPILLPIKKYEIEGLEEKGVVFPTGLLLDEDNRHILLFSGAGDRYTTIKKISLSKIMKKFEKDK